MKNEFVLALNQISAERTLPREIISKVIEAALVQSYRKYANVMVSQQVAASVDMDSGDMRVFVEKEVVDSVLDDRTEVVLDDAKKQKPDAEIGDCIMIDVTPKDFGRIAAQNAKQLIVQKLREAERDFQYNQFAEREGEIVNGMVQSISVSGIVLNLGRAEATLPKKEMLPGEKYEGQQRVRAYVTEVKRNARGPQIILSRTNKNFLKRLLEIEVPEIANNAVEIKSITREPGSRSKVAVAALQPNVDPIGACVGQGGKRIQSIISELRGEKIDIIEWNNDPTIFITKALGPAKVMSVHPSSDVKNATVIVPDDQLSLAIGREGQNARLAARLTGWRIDIKSGTEALGDAIAKISDDEAAQNFVGEEAMQSLPNLRELLVRQRTVPQPLSPEEFALVKRVVDSAHQYGMTHIVEPTTETKPESAKPSVVEEKKSARDAAKAAIPKEAYGMGLESLGLSPRVLQHITASGVSNVGQLLELNVRGDEGLLSIEGIGSKALSEIKQSLEKVIGATKPDEPVAIIEPVAELVEETPEQAQAIFIEAMSEGEGDEDEMDEDGAVSADITQKRTKQKLKKGKLDKKGKERALYFDEELGRMMPVRHGRDDGIDDD
jgi:N utilization substance protein A